MYQTELGNYIVEFKVQDNIRTCKLQLLPFLYRIPVHGAFIVEINETVVVVVLSRQERALLPGESSLERRG